jgi:hypothetical protein
LRRFPLAPIPTCADSHLRQFPLAPDSHLGRFERECVRVICICEVVGLVSGAPSRVSASTQVGYSRV